ncbi:hypothetical protein D3C78_1794870 [compost metagenome]
MCRDNDRVQSRLRDGSVRATPLHFNDEPVCSGHYRSFLDANHTCRQIGLVVQTEDSLYLLQCTTVNDQSGSLRILLRRLEEQPHSPL